MTQRKSGGYVLFWSSGKATTNFSSSKIFFDLYIIYREKAKYVEDICIFCAHLPILIPFLFIYLSPTSA